MPPTSTGRRRFTASSRTLKPRQCKASSDSARFRSKTRRPIPSWSSGRSAIRRPPAVPPSPQLTTPGQMGSIRSIFDDKKARFTLSTFPMSSDCLFCMIVAGTIPANRVHEDERCIIFPDINPQAPTHLLIIPKQHIVSLATAVAKDTPLIGHLMAVAAEIARTYNLDAGYRVVVNTGGDGGQTVNHLHLHLLGGRRMKWPPG